MDKTLWNILLIDDDEDDYVLTRSMLNRIRGADCRLDWSPTYEAGQEALQARTYDAVLVDYYLGAEKGLELIRESVARGFAAPFILLTGHGSYEVDVEAMQAGAALYLSKAEVTPLLLERTIRYSIQYKHVLQELEEARAGLELKVQERTTEIAQVNRELRSEIATRRSTEEIVRLQSTALEAAADGIMITGRDGVIRWVNPALSAMTGYSASELIGSTPVVFRSGLHSQEYYAELWNTILSGNVWRGETYNRRKDGSIYVEEQTITPVFDGSGLISSFIAIKHDVTERKRAEEEIAKLFEAERRAHRLADTLRNASLALSRSLDPMVVLQTTIDSIRRLIPEADRFLGFTYEEGCLELRVLAGKGVRTSMVQGMQLAHQDYPLLWEALEAKAGRMVADVSIRPNWKPVMPDFKTRSWLGIPVLFRGNVFGLCCLEAETPGRFTHHHISLTKGLLAQTGIAIQNAFLYQEVRESQERLQTLSRHLVEVQETERSFIARELHDETSQALVGLMFALESLKSETGDPQAIAASIDNLEGLIGGILSDLHRLAVDLRPATLDHLGLIPALRQYVDGIREKSGLAVQLTVPDLPGRLPPDIETNLYRIIQEALANVVRHSKATHVEVAIELGMDCLQVSIVDNGLGFIIEEALAKERLGLFGMRERAEILEGTLTVESRPGLGTRIFLEAPCDLTNIDRG